MSKTNKKPISKEELLKIFEAVAKAYEQAGKPIAYGTLYSQDDIDGTILVPSKEGEPELEFETDEDDNRSKFED